MNAGTAASVHARLLALAKSRGEDFNLTLNRYGLERFLYRLSVSPAREHYWLKGALLFVSLGMANSRMKDYFDLRALAREGAIDGDELTSAVAATFARRKTPLPDGLPLGLSDEFALDAGKKAQWKGFLGKNRLDAPSLEEVVAEVRQFVEPPLKAAFKGRS